MNKRTFDEMSSWALPLNTASLLKSGTYSDLLIRTKLKDFKVHRSVVCLQSEPMAGMLRGDSKEAKESLIDLKNDNPEHIEIMINFLYTGKLSIPTSIEPSTATTEPSKAVGLFGMKSNPPPEQTQVSATPDTSAAQNLLLCTYLYVLGDYWQIFSLKSAVAKAYKRNLEHGWNSTEFSTSLKWIFESTTPDDRMLADIALEWAGKKAAELLDRGDFVEVCKENAELSFEVMKATVNNRKEAVPTKKSVAAPRCLNIHPESVTKNYDDDYTWWCHKCKKDF